MILDVLLGIVGAVIGGWVAHLLGYAGVTRLNLYGVLVATLGAIVLLFVYHAVRRNVIGLPDSLTAGYYLAERRDFWRLQKAYQK